MTLTKTEIQFLEDVLETALREIEELESQIDWYTSSVPYQLEEALEMIRGKSGHAEA